MITDLFFAPKLTTTLIPLGTRTESKFECIKNTRPKPAFSPNSHFHYPWALRSGTRTLSVDASHQITCGDRGQNRSRNDALWQIICQRGAVLHYPMGTGVKEWVRNIGILLRWRIRAVVIVFGIFALGDLHDAGGCRFCTSRGLGTTDTRIVNSDTPRFVLFSAPFRAPIAELDGGCQKKKKFQSAGRALFVQSIS